MDLASKSRRAEGSRGTHRSTMRGLFEANPGGTAVDGPPRVKDHREIIRIAASDLVSFRHPKLVGFVPHDIMRRLNICLSHLVGFSDVSVSGVSSMARPKTRGNIPPHRAKAGEAKKRRVNKSKESHLDLGNVVGEGIGTSSVGVNGTVVVSRNGLGKCTEGSCTPIDSTQEGDEEATFDTSIHATDADATSFPGGP
ncbi:hypothetical protein Scep_016824 [Stephania cephalantha]|uniref:Uncharacterized protein n=1 Tax=Stephania cephalantha TaxID=152367 RepID=A0AAP0ING6_9MAGN